MQIILSLIAIVAPVAIYWFIVRPRLQERFVNLYSHIGSFWARWWARAVAFRTLIVGAVGLIIPELVSLMSFLTTQDLSILPQPWESGIRIAALIAIMLGRAVSTAPREEPPKG